MSRRTRGLALLRIEVSKRAHYEGQKQPDFAFPRKTKGLIETVFRLLKIAAHHLHQTAAVIGSDHIVRPLILFGEIARQSSSIVRTRSNSPNHA